MYHGDDLLPLSQKQKVKVVTLKRKSVNMIAKDAVQLMYKKAKKKALRDSVAKTYRTHKTTSKPPAPPTLKTYSSYVVLTAPHEDAPAIKKPKAKQEITSVSKKLKKIDFYLKMI